jgi:hypothetical protein
MNRAGQLEPAIYTVNLTPRTGLKPQNPRSSAPRYAVKKVIWSSPRSIMAISLSTDKHQQASTSTNNIINGVSSTPAGQVQHTGKPFPRRHKARKPRTPTAQTSTNEEPKPPFIYVNTTSDISLKAHDMPAREPAASQKHQPAQPVGEREGFNTKKDIITSGWINDYLLFFQTNAFLPSYIVSHSSSVVCCVETCPLKVSMISHLCMLGNHLHPSNLSRVIFMPLLHRFRHPNPS